MRHVQKALSEFYKNYGETSFIKLDNVKDEKGVAPVVSFEIQSDPIGDVGVNGVQCTDIIKYALCLLRSLNSTFPCRENSLSITKLEEALHWQDARTRDRVFRGVEGHNAE